MKKSWLLLIVVLLLPHYSIAQSGIDVRVNEPSYNFGYIKEAEGKVSVDFEFKNYSAFNVKIVKAISTCGCAVVKVDKEAYKPNSTGKITIEYDPNGRPGKFVKSFEIIFGKDSVTTQSIFLNIRGYTIEKELLEAYVDNLYEGSKLFIKPSKFSLINESDFRFIESGNYQNFLNDITYEIDENGFANVKIEILFSLNNKKTECDKYQNIYSFIHRDITQELKRREYNAYQIGFKDTCLIDEKMALQTGAIIKISSIKYNNDTVVESGYYFSGKSIDEKRFQFDRFKDSLAFAKKEISFYKFKTSKDLNDEKFEKYSDFLKQTSRRLIVQNSVNLGMTVNIKCHPSSEQKIREKSSKEIQSYYEKIKKDIDDLGGSPGSLKFSLPNFLFIQDSLTKPGKVVYKSFKISLFTNEAKLPGENVFENYILNDTIGKHQLKDFLTQTGFETPFQNLPVFKTSSENNSLIDTNDLFFRTWLKIIKEELTTGKKINFVIESSIANSPNEKLTSLEFQARKNAKTSTEKLQKLMQVLSIPDSLYTIKIESAIVQGARYNSKEFNVSYNHAFNYVKIIPNYQLNKLEKQVVVPYQINFNNNSFELPSNTSIFQNFISRLIPVIEKQGYVNLIIESSSSKVPSTIYKNNDLLSYFRAQQAIQTVKEEVSKRGYDPSRIIIGETRTLVQGPEFKKESDKTKYSYDKFQYVKIIPDVLIRN